MVGGGKRRRKSDGPRKGVARGPKGFEHVTWLKNAKPRINVTESNNKGGETQRVTKIRVPARTGGYTAPKVGVCRM